MNRKLTLSMDSNVIDFAHNFSKKTNKPVSQIVEHYFIALKQQNTAALPKGLEELYGIFEGIEAPDKKELRRMFHEKHRRARAVNAVKLIQQQSVRNGTDTITLDEINYEIKMARKKRQ